METASEATNLLAIWGTGGAILLLLVFSGIFSGSETALTTASRGKLHAMAEKGDKGAAKALRLTDDKERLIGAILLGNNLVNILATSLATMLFTTLLGDSAVAVATLVMTLLVLIFSEVLPKTYAITNSELMARRVSHLIRAIVVVLSPIVNSVRALVRLILSAFGVKTDPEANFLAAQEEIAGAIALHHSEGAVEKADRDRLLGALDLGQRTVSEIMLHRRDIEMLDIGNPAPEIIEKALKSPHTRIPLYSENSENIVGVLHAKDMFRALHRIVHESEEPAEALANFDIMDVSMEPYFVPETTALDEQMREFLRRRSHFALVVDEYGALKGLITLEDILEEIVGEIADEHDTEPPSGIVPFKDGSVEVEGVMTIRDLNRACEWHLPDEEANTVAGLVIHEAQAIPNAGQVFSFHGFRFEVLERQNNRLTKLRVRKLG
ncbi:HlyC/CorC family transporter [Amaricoccus macauensis]|uniref:HlyC/CorC family transporter n=1 Tax=Amaricoccus macauensis TaxID=57001 RepID=UPI003C7A7A53